MRSRFLVGGPLMSMGVFGEINVAVGRDAQSGRRLNVRSFEDDFTLKAVGHFGQRFGGGDGKDAERRKEREEAGCHGKHLSRQAGGKGSLRDTIRGERGKG